MHSYAQTITTTPNYKPHKLTFKEDLFRGYEIELMLKAWFEKNYPDCTVTTFHGDKSFSDYDLLVDFHDGSPVLSIEAKEDKLVSKTGNIAVELARMVYGEKKDTCLSISKSDIYVYFFDNAFHFIETDTLRKLVDDKKYSRCVWGGDAGKAWCALFKKEVFIQHSIKENAC